MIPKGLILANLGILLLIIMMVSKVDIGKPFRLLFTKKEKKNG